MIVVKYLGTASFLIRGERIDEEFTQEMADLARELALHPELIPWVDTETMEVKP